MHFAKGAAFFARGNGLRFREHFPTHDHAPCGQCVRDVIQRIRVEDHEPAEVASMTRMWIIRGAYIFAAVCG